MKNLAVRQQNGIVVHSQVPLDPMYDVETGDLIDDFPETLGDLDNLNGRRHPPYLSSASACMY